MFHINFDASELKSLMNIEEAFNDAVKDAEKQLAAMTYTKAVDLATSKLHSRRQMFVDALSIKEEDGVTIVNLNGSARWIDDGQEPHSMLEALLKSPKAKRAADGSMYVVVPFDHGPGKGPANSPESQQPMINALKKEFKQRKIPWGKIERDDQGRPKMGKIHSFDMSNTPIKTGEGAGQGHGKTGAVRQGSTGIPFLQGVAVYQHGQAGGGAKKSVMTFRTASSNQQGAWQHPGVEAANIMEETWKWAQETMEREIIPLVIESLSKSL